MAAGRIPTTANSPITAKGDLFTYSTAPARLAVGNNGETLVADSAATTGLAYKSAATLYPWTTWSPTYSNLTIGNGTVTARYQQIGKLVTVFWKLVWGSTTSFTAYPIIALPVAAAQNDILISGVSQLADASAGTIFNGYVWSETGGTAFQPMATNASSTYAYSSYLTANTIPMTWTTSDVMICRFTYEAA
jgi:hypothetical protein